MKEVIELLKEKKQTIATMESCTGGFLANAITNIEGASEVYEFSAVTYSNQFKIKMGVDEKVIEKYSVYSIETAMEMSKKISLFANADIGIGVTGKINREDVNNNYGKDNQIFVSIYEQAENQFHNLEITAQTTKTREENKELVLEEVTKMVKTILESKKMIKKL